MAKRGCWLRSIRRTVRPSRRAIMAQSEPVKPEPTTARSNSAGMIIGGAKGWVIWVGVAGACEGRLKGLFPVHLFQAFFALEEALAAVSKCFQVPQVSEHSTLLQADAVFDGSFESCDAGWGELALSGEGVQGPVPGAGGNDGGYRGPAFKGEMERAFRPLERFGFLEEREFEQDKDTKGDVVLVEEAGCASELVESHSFIEAAQDFRMDCLEAHGDFQFAGEPVAKAEDWRADEGWVRFDDDALERSEFLGDGWMIFGRDGVWIEEATAVVEFDLGDRRAKQR